MHSKDIHTERPCKIRPSKSRL